MGTNPDFFTDAIEGRVKNYYDLAMGGAAVSGKDNGVGFTSLTTDYLKANPVGTSATFEVESKTLDPNRISAEITVTVTASEALTDGLRLHVAVVETEIDMVDLYGAPTKNGQAYIYYVVRELLTGAEGEQLQAMAQGATHTFTGIFTRETNIQNADSLRVTTLIQNEDTKEILAGAATTSTAIPVPTSILHKGSTVKDTKPLVYSTNKGAFVVVLPFSDVTATIFNIHGRKLGQYRLTGSAGQKAFIPRPRVRGLLLLKLVAGNEKTTHRILCK